MRVEPPPSAHGTPKPTSELSNARSNTSLHRRPGKYEGKERQTLLLQLSSHFVTIHDTEEVLPGKDCATWKDESPKEDDEAPTRRPGFQHIPLECKSARLSPPRVRRWIGRLSSPRRLRWSSLRGRPCSGRSRRGPSSSPPPPRPPPRRCSRSRCRSRHAPRGRSRSRPSRSPSCSGSTNTSGHSPRRTRSAARRGPPAATPGGAGRCPTCRSPPCST